MTEKKGLKKEQKKTLKTILIVITIILADFVVAFFVLMGAGGSFEYRGVDFTRVSFCDAGPPCLVTYNTKVPIEYEGKPANYNFYLRNDPRKLEKEVVFYGDLLLKKDMDMKITFNTSCGGYEKIALENFLNLHKIVGINITSEEDISCDLLGNRMNVLIEGGNETIVRQV